MSEVECIVVVAERGDKIAVAKRGDEIVVTRGERRVDVADRERGRG